MDFFYLLKNISLLFQIFFYVDDIFGIDEVSIYEGEWNEKVYSVAGSVLETVSKCIFLIRHIYAFALF